MLSMLWKLDGYLVIPHELLHVLAYRLIGKRCSYQLGDHGVNSLEERTVSQRLFCLLFPFLVNSLVLLLFVSIWFVTYITARYPLNPLAYLQTAPTWHQLFFWGWLLSVTYIWSCLWDVIFAGRLLMEKLSQQPPKNSRLHVPGTCGYRSDQTPNGGKCRGRGDPFFYLPKTSYGIIN